MTPARNAGLTLLEVLAAFLIFSLVFTVLVGSSQKGVQSQAIAAQRLEANEKADAAMTQLEIDIALGQLALVDSDEIVDEDHIIRLSNVKNGGFDPALIALIEAQLPGFSKYLTRLDVEVEWSGGNQTRTVSRSTLNYDLQGARMDPALVFSGAESLTDGGRTGDSTTTGDGSGNGDVPSQPGNAGESDAEMMQRMIRESGRTIQ